MLTLFFDLVAFSQLLPTVPPRATLRPFSGEKGPGLASTLALGQRLPQMPLAQRAGLWGGRGRGEEDAKVSLASLSAG